MHPADDMKGADYVVLANLGASEAFEKLKNLGLLN